MEFINRIRNYWFGNYPFGPGEPLEPYPINENQTIAGVGETRQPAPRRTQAPISFNLQFDERIQLFQQLRQLAEDALIDSIIRKVKDKVVAQKWVFGLREDNTLTTMQKRARTEEHRDHIKYLTNFWCTPDRANGRDWNDWIRESLQDILTLDAWALYPRWNLFGEVSGIEVIDGATIKPVLDDRGSRPLPPAPAYQQILWGFPRSDFRSTVFNTSGTMTVEELFYFVNNPRSYTPYGKSPVETAGQLIKLFTKRIEWLLNEYTDGSIPVVLLEQLLNSEDEILSWTAEQIDQYETILNNDLSGNLKRRHQFNSLPPNTKAVFPPSHESQYRTDLDEFIVRIACMPFGILPTELGFAPKGGLGGSGVQQGENETSKYNTRLPLLNWLAEKINFISLVLLKMPNELEFKFVNDHAVDEKIVAERQVLQVVNGIKTLDEIRIENGDEPFNRFETMRPTLPVIGGGEYVKKL